MKTYLKRLLAVFLCVALCAANCGPVQAANESNSLGVTFGVTLDTPTIQASSQDQTVVMRLTASQEIKLDGMGFKVTMDSGLVLTSITGGDAIGAFSGSQAILESGTVAWSSDDSENVTGVTELAVITFTVPANTAAGTYNVGITELELTQAYGEVWESSASAQTTLTIEAAAASVEGYTAGISTSNTVVRVGDTVTVNVAVGHHEDSSYAAGEVAVSYDSAKLSFNQIDSTLGTATVNNGTGTLKLEDYGADKSFGDAVYVLVFDAIAEGSATVTLDSAAFVDKTGAETKDLIAAAISPAAAVVTVNKEAYAVTLPDILTGVTEVEDGEDYTFTVENPNYDYTITATVDGETVTVIDNGDGTYTVENVTGALEITATRTEKNYSVSFEGNAAGGITDGANTATYNTPYTFTVPSAEGWAYSLDSITIGGTAYTGYSMSDSVYTIPGAAITGDIVITVSKSQTEASVTVEGTGAGAAAGYDAAADIGESYTLTIVPEAGYTYTVSATMNGAQATVVDNGDNTYTIESVTGNIIFTVNRTVITSGVTVESGAYLTLNETNMWLVKNDTTVADGKVPTYDGNAMFWSDKYNAYCYLIVAETLSLDAAKALVGITDGTAVSVDYGMDVNKTGKVDASDAQLTYNMYNAMYAGFTDNVTMVKYLRADVNGDKLINVEDAAAIISSILGTN